MKARKKSSHLYRLSFLSLVGSAVSTYLLYHHVEVRGNYLIGQSACNLGARFNCDQVAESAFAEFLNLPVASWAILYYLMIFFVLQVASKDNERNVSRVALFLSILALVPTFLLFLVSAFILKTFCLFCAVLYVVNLLSCIVAWNNPILERGFKEEFYSGKDQVLSFLPSISDIARYKIAGFGILLLVVLFFSPQVLARFWFEPRILKIKSQKALAPIIENWKAQKEHLNLVSEEDSPQIKDYSYGPKDAEITLVEFSDFECPYCKKAGIYLKPLVAKYPGKVRVVFKNFPLDLECNPSLQAAPHKFACKAAILARCAGMQGEDEFWKMHDKIFSVEWWKEHSLSEIIEDSFFKEKLSKCMEEGIARKRVLEDVDMGAKLGISGTPSLFLNGRKLTFPQLEALPGIIEAILSENKK
jgi:protein-disulfide isomerase/uncharacterized membrane protein